MVNPMSATSTCISRIIMDPLLVFCTAFHFNYELGKYQITEKFYQTTIKLIKYTCLIHFKKDLIPYIKLPNTHSIPANSHALGVSLTPAGWKLRSHACGPISHAWLKNVSCCRPAWHNFQKYVNSDPCKERKPCVKWINGNTFLAISDFWSEKHWERARLWQTSAVFGLFRKTSDIFGNLRKWSCCFQESQHSQDKNLTPTSEKKLAGIIF